eukprot:scaffold147029_cov19-Tisochrysis_lutea.AAC.3
MCHPFPLAQGTRCFVLVVRESSYKLRMLLQDDGEQASGFGKQARQKRSVAWRASIMGSQASRSGQSSRQDPLACGVDLDASHSNLIVKHKSGRLARRSPPLDVPSPPRPPPSAPANCTAPLDACVPLFRKPKQHMPSGNQGPECKGIQPRSRSGSDDGDVHNNGGGVQESGTIGDQDSAAGGIQDGDAGERLSSPDISQKPVQQ